MRRLQVIGTASGSAETALPGIGVSGKRLVDLTELQKSQAIIFRPTVNEELFAKTENLKHSRPAEYEHQELMRKSEIVLRKLLRFSETDHVNTCVLFFYD